MNIQKMIIKKAIVSYFILIACTFCTLNLYSQNVAITDNETYTAENSAMLDVMSTSKGMLVPRLNTTQRTGITGPATGLMVYDTNVKSFMYFNGTKWITIPQLASSAGSGEALFAVVNQLGDTVFAVYHDGVRIFVDPDAKGTVGGFAISGRTPTKAGGKVEYFRVTPDSTRIYVNDSIGSKGSVGGFAISGRTPTKENGIKEYFSINKDSTRIYIDSTANKGKVGGFAISGRTPTKAGYSANDYFNISASSSAEIIDNEARIMWYPKKSAFLAGEVHVGLADSVGTNSTALGYRSIAFGNYSQAMGYNAKALGLNSTAIGNYAIAKSTNSFAFGDSSQAINTDAYAFGAGAKALGIGSYAFGSLGRDTLTFEPTSLPTIAEGDYSFAIGQGAYAKGKISTSIGNNTSAIGKNSLALGSNTTASGDYSTSMGNKSTASGPYSTAMGFQTNASNNYSTAIGASTTASGGTSFAAGAWTTASGALSVATGYSCFSTGYISFTMGMNTQATGQRSFAAGYGSKASGDNSVAIGEGAVSQAFNSFVVGRYNVIEGNLTDWITTDPLFVIGYGQSHSKANAVTVLKNGYVGIGINPPTQKLDINGQIRIRGGSPGANKVLTSDADGVGSWSTLDLSNISGTLTVAQGGTGRTTLTANKILVGYGTSAILYPTNLHWDNTNSRLGIGTALPQNTLHLFNTSSEVLALQRNSTITTNTTGILFKVSTNTNNEQFKGGIFYELTSAAGIGRLHFAINGAVDNTNASLSDARMTIASNGYIGINDISPSYNLDINGTGRFVNDVYLASSSGNVGIGNTSTTYKLDVSGIIRSTLSAYLATSSGNVGIGTESPAQKLDVRGNTYISGNVGIGASSPLQKLDVRGNIYVSGNVGIGVSNPGSMLDIVGFGDIFRVRHGTYGHGLIIDPWNSATSAVNIDPMETGQAIYFGRDIAAGSWTFSSGNVYVGSTLVHSSDIRLKKDIENLKYGLKEILKLRSVSFNWKNNSNVKKEIGFIAQEAESVINELVLTSDDEMGTKSINYIGLTPVIVNAIKEQQQLIDTQNGELQNFKLELELLKSENQELRQKLNEIIGLMQKE